MKSLDKALEIYCAFNDGSPDLGVKDICERTGLQKSQVSKVLQTFREHKLLRQDPVTRRYSVGQRSFSIGSSFVNNHILSKVSLPIVRQVVELSGHSTALTIMNGDIVHLLAVEGPLFLDARWRVGRIITFHAAASARVLLAFRPREVVEGLIERHGLRRLTEHSITDPAELFARLGQIPGRGYDVSRSERVVGLGGLAVPVFDERQEVVAALDLIFPEHLIDADSEERHVAVLHDAARRLSARLGATIYPYGAVAPPEARQGGSG